MQSSRRRGVAEGWSGTSRGSRQAGLDFRSIPKASVCTGRACRETETRGGLPASSTFEPEADRPGIRGYDLHIRLLCSVRKQGLGDHAVESREEGYLHPTTQTHPGRHLPARMMWYGCWCHHCCSLLLVVSLLLLCHFRCMEGTCFPAFRLAPRSGGGAHAGCHSCCTTPIVLQDVDLSLSVPDRGPLRVESEA